MMQDPRDDETLVKFLVNLKQKCIAAEIGNRDLREMLKALKAEFASVSHRWGVRKCGRADG